jgi:hypothetical protein
MNSTLPKYKTEVNHMADEEKYLLMDNSHWTCSKNWGVFQVTSIRIQLAT